MKPLRSILTAGFALALLSTTMRGEVFPILEDTAGSVTTGLTLKATGAAKTLAVSAKSTAFLSFGVGASAIDPATVTAARLTIFFPRVTRAGVLTFSNLDSAFAETFVPRNAANPTVGAALGTVDLATVPLNREFLVVDITAQVKAWLTTPASEFGIAISSDGTASCTLASKEGAGTGHPAIIEVDVNRGGGSISGTTLAITGNTTLGGSTNVNTFAATGGATVNTLTSSGAATVGSLASNGAISGSSLSISGNSSLNTLTASGAATVGSLSTNGAISGVGGSFRNAINIPVPSGLSVTSLLTFNGTFFNFPADQAPRRTADIQSGFGSSQFQFLSLRVGVAGGGNNDAANLTNEVMRLTGLGRVGIGTSDPATPLHVRATTQLNPTPVITMQRDNDVQATWGFDINGNTNLHVVRNGAVVGFFTASGFTDNSDRKLKKDIAAVGPVLDKVMQLEPVSYRFKTMEETEKPTYGFIAQDVEPIFPNVVKDNDQNLGITYTAMVPVAIAALQELKKEKDAEIAALKAANLALAEKMAAFGEQLTALQADRDTRPARTVRASLDLK